MRPAVLFFVTTLFILPSVVFGVEPEAKPKPVTGSSDRCLDEKVAIINGKAVLAQGKTDTERYKTCRTISGGCSLQKEKEKVCICGRMIYTTLEKKTLILDKCDPDMQKKLAKAMAGGAAAMESFAMQALLTERIQGIDASTEKGRDQLSQILQNYGLSEADADTKVNDEKDADIVKSQLQRFVSTSNTAEANDIANELGLKLNENLTDAVRLDPSRYAAVFTAEELARVQGAQSSTFPDIEKLIRDAGPNIAAAVASMCNQQGMGGCGYACNVPNPNTATCPTNNPGALTFTGWQTQYGGRPCGLANNTTCFDTVEGGIAAQANLLMTSPRYFGTGNNSILGAFCNGYSTSNCAQYASFISAQTGIPINQTIDPRNTEQIAAIMMASSRFENGRGVVYTPEQLQKGLQVAFGNETLPVGTPGYIPRTVYGTNGGTQFDSPFNFNSSATPAPIGYGSPFAQASPAPIAQSNTQSTAPIQTSQQIQLAQNSNQSSSVAEQLQQALGNATSTASSAIAIVVAQPKEVARGNPITVSWSSVGMSTESPCILRAGATVIAQKNQGSSIVPTSQATRLGSLIFTLECTSSFGAAIRRTAATFVH